MAAVGAHATTLRPRDNVQADYGGDRMQGATAAPRLPGARSRSQRLERASWFWSVQEPIVEMVQSLSTGTRDSSDRSDTLGLSGGLPSSEHDASCLLL